MKINTNEFRRGNWVLDQYSFYSKIETIRENSVTIINPNCAHEVENHISLIKFIPLTEDKLLKFGFVLLDENSAGKRYGLLNNNVFDRDTILIIWKNNQRAGKIFRGNKEIKYVHKLQNLIFELTDRDLEINL